MIGRVLGAIALAIGTCSTTHAHHAAQAVAPDAPSYRTTQRDIRAQSHGYCLTLAIYFEGGSTFEPEVGQRHIARVIHERARANLRKWGGSDICDVVFYMRNGVCQFSFTCLSLARRTPRFGPVWHRAREIAETLWITRKTVELHLGSAYGKLGIASRRQLADVLGPPPERSAA